jgi:hypothetical protein
VRVNSALKYACPLVCSCGAFSEAALLAMAREVESAAACIAAWTAAARL